MYQVVTIQEGTFCSEYHDSYADAVEAAKWLARTGLTARVVWERMATTEKTSAAFLVDTFKAVK